MAGTNGWCQGHSYFLLESVCYLFTLRLSCIDSTTILLLYCLLASSCKIHMFCQLQYPFSMEVKDVCDTSNLALLTQDVTGSCWCLSMSIWVFSGIFKTLMTTWKRNTSYSLTYLNAWSSARSTIWKAITYRRCGITAEVGHCGQTMRVHSPVLLYVNALLPECKCKQDRLVSCSCLHAFAAMSSSPKWLVFSFNWTQNKTLCLLVSFSSHFIPTTRMF